MAQFSFNVARKGQTPIACVAQVPSAEEMRKFPGGEVLVKTPKGDRKVSLSAALDMIIDKMTVELQNGVRDFLFPTEASPKSNGKRSKGYTS